MLKAAEDRQREREEQSWKKHEKQLEDMKEYYESEIKDLEEKLKTQNDAIGGKTTGSMEQSEQSLREKNRWLIFGFFLFGPKRGICRDNNINLVEN